jgi:lipopolysaccharide transport system permease protein
MVDRTIVPDCGLGLHAMLAPVTTKAQAEIVRSPRGPGIDLRELWRSRELAYLLIQRDIKVRYKQTAFGVGWALAQPLLMMLIFTLFLGRVPDLHPQGVSYPLFALAALIPWTYFAQGLTGASNSLVGNERLITKVYFPRLVLPIAAVCSYLPDLAIGTAVLLGGIVLFGPALHMTILAVVPLAVLATFVAIAFGVLLSAINVRYRDVRYAVPFLIQLWLFATPVVYSSDIVPAGLRWLLILNPMTGVVEGFRWASLGLEPRPDVAVAVSVIVTAVACLIAAAYFRRAERTFADVI